MKINMKDTMKKYIPIFVIIFSALGIYFIIFKKRKEYYDNKFQAIEQFMNSNIEHFEDQQQQNALTNQDFTSSLASGIWTSDSSTIVNGTLENYISISVSDDNKGTVSYITSEGKVSGNINNIIFLGNMTLTAQDPKNKNISIQIDFQPIVSVKNPLVKDMIPEAIITIRNGNTVIDKYNSFKVYDINNIGGKLSRIILSKHFYTEPTMKYDLVLYNKYLNLYKYPSNPFQVIYGTNTTTKDLDMNKLKNNYQNLIYLAYQREYYTTNNETVKTKISPAFVISAVNSSGKIFSKIILNNIEKENQTNHLTKNFFPKQTWIYFYKEVSVKNTFKFLKNETYNKNTFNFHNQADSMFNKNRIEIPNLEKSQLTVQGTYDLTLLKTMATPDIKTTLTIVPSDFKNML